MSHRKIPIKFGSDRNSKSMKIQKGCGGGVGCAKIKPPMLGLGFWILIKLPLGVPVPTK